MAEPRDIPSASEIFLARKTTRKRRTPAATPAPTLFDSLITETVEVAAAPAPPPVEAPAADIARVWAVADLVREVRGLVEDRYARVTVEGEISNWRPAASGHWYFTLKDGAAQLAVVMFRREAAMVRFKPKDGDAVRLRGQLSVYESRGQMQLIADRMELAGIGAQLAAVQELKARLKREGLFARKRELPAFPKCIGVVTSLQGAALRDIVKVCKRRHAAVKLLIYPAAVQGPRCAAEVAAGVRWFSAHLELVDVVIVARGGGSWEDLHGFDDERVVRAIAACDVPVVTGIGHATDSVLADSAADVCAPTPSAAAELVTAAQHRVEERVARLEARVRRAGGYELLRMRQRLSQLGAEAILRAASEGVRRRAQRVDELEFRMEAALARLALARTQNLAMLETRLQRQDVTRKLAADRRQLELLHERLRRTGTQALEGRARQVERLTERADAMSPLRVLERGYALVYGADGKLLRSAEAASTGEAIVARLAEGSLEATVTRRR